ncbi:FYVE and coiled-coil domain-containing protein 1 [Aplochiton taeniatus]
MERSSVGENQLQRIIKDLHDSVTELTKEHKECAEPITDDSFNLHKFSFKLEYLLQFDQKEKTTFLGHRKDYWDFFCDCLVKIKGANDGIRFVKAIPELKTSLGKGRAFIRYSLVHQRLGDTLQQCLINQKVTSEWYYARSPFLKSHLTADIINYLYELNEIQFDLAARGYDLDADWPTFARRMLGGNSPAYLWKPPSRCSSINSLVSYSQAQEFHPIPDFTPSLLGDLGELGEPSPCSVADDLRIELDQSELRQQELLAQVKQLTKEAAMLKGEVRDLKAQILVTQTPTDQSLSSEKTKKLETANKETEHLLRASREASNSNRAARLSAAEDKNMELLSKLGGALSEKGQQTASYCDSAWKIQELLDKLKAAEEDRLGARREAEDRGRLAERLAQELTLQEVEARRSEETLSALKAGAREEHEVALERVVELQGVVGRIQGSLTLKEKETGNLRAQLQDLQTSLDSRERQAEELRRRLQEEIQERSSGGEGQNEGQQPGLKEELQARERELAASKDRVRHLEEQVENLAGEKRGLSGATGSAVPTQDHAKRLEDYKSQCTSLMELNDNLLQTVKRSKENTREMVESRAAMLEQLAALRASEKHLRGRVEAAKMTVEEREQRLTEDNRRLEENAERARTQAEALEAKQKSLEQENKELTEGQHSLKKQLASAQKEFNSLTAKASRLEKDLSTSQTTRAELQDKLRDAQARVQDHAQKGELLQARVEELEGQAGEMGTEKGAAEKMEKIQPEPCPSPSAEAHRLVLAEAHLELNHQEVSRLQGEVVELKAQLLVGAEEHVRLQALQEVSAASKEDLGALSEQLKDQVEELNRRHVDELLRSQEREEVLARERDGEALARASLAAEVTAATEELRAWKRRCDELCAETAEAKDALHRANTETAELGVHVCMLTAENQDARFRWEGVSSRLQELEEEATLDAEKLSHQLHQGEGLSAAMQELQARLDEAQQETRGLQKASLEETQALRFQLSCQAMDHVNQLQGVKKQLKDVKLQLGAEKERMVSLEAKVKQLEARGHHSSTRETQENTKIVEEKTSHIADSERELQQKDEELCQLKEKLSRSEEGLALAERTCQELNETLRRATQDKQSVDLRTSAELDDLYRTKINLEERLIELIREKDALWQKSDALEFEQKLRDEETERDVNHCVGCHSQFSWWLRKHNCRLCGRPFCYYCCSNAVSTQQGGGRERCCRDCYTQHSAVVERHPQEDAGSTPGTPFGPLPQPGRAVTSSTGTDRSPTKPEDDGVFDIITEDEVNGVYDTDSFTTACSPSHGHTAAAEELNSSASIGDTTSEDAEDVSASVQDAEICLLSAGELTLSVPFTMEDIAEFGDGSRELFIKSSCYSTIPIAVGNPGATIAWVFTSEPKSISFSVVHREDAETPLEQAKVLIPLTRCKSHKETIQGELKVRNAGEYTLIFDNSFSRFISKKVLYRLSMEEPVVYDGSDGQ